MTIWGWSGFAVVIYLAALQGIPQDLIEAAAVDGAGRWSTFRKVTLPLLSPASLFLAVWLTINALQLFDEVYLSTQGGPLGATTVLVYYLYQQAFENFNFGYASAIAYLLFLDHPRGHGDPVPGRPAVHLLPVMTAREIGASAVARSRMAGQRSRLPFSPWHLVLIPADDHLAVPVRLAAGDLDRDSGRGTALPADPDPARDPAAELPRRAAAAPFGRFFLNSAIVAVTTVISNLVLCALAGYAFARFRFLGRGAAVRPDHDHADGAVPGHHDPAVHHHQMDRACTCWPQPGSGTSAR